MKKITCFILTLLLASAAVPTDAKVKFGVKGGLNISSVHLNSDILKTDNVTGFQIGPMMEATVPLVGVGMDIAVLYSQKGTGVALTDGVSADVKTDYIDVPLNLKWKFGLPIVKGYFAAGPYVGFRIGGDKVWDIPGNVVGQVEAKSFGAGLNFGAGVELISHLQVGINYTLGLTDNYSVKKLDLNAKNRGWGVTAAFLF